MTKRIVQLTALVLVFVTLFSLCSCGKKEFDSKGEKTADGTTVWYLGGNNLMISDVDVKELFAEYKDTVSPKTIYNSITLTEDMLQGVYMLNNKEKDVKTLRKEMPYEKVTFGADTYEMIKFPVSVHLGAKFISNIETKYHYSEYENITDKAVAVLEMATKDDLGFVVCTYEINGNTITFKSIDQTSKEGEPFAYEFDGPEFTYNLELAGPNLTLSSGEYSTTLVSYAFSENNDSGLYMTGYSLPDSPLAGNVDYFCSSESFNYAVKRGGDYVDLSAYKIDSQGRFTACFEERDMVSKEKDRFVQQYACIIQSSVGFFNDFSIILLDGEKTYYYTDDITDREARALEEQGADVAALSEDEIKEIAEKKSDLFDDLQSEFEEQGIKAVINRSTGEIAMDASVLFGGDSATITADGKTLLNKFLNAYIGIIYNEKYDGFIEKTIVEGHTAPLANSTYESGLPLSEERANNVKDYCLSAESGADVAKLSTMLEAKGMSNSKPVYDANGEIDLAACRRVSFRLVVNLEKQG